MWFFFPVFMPVLCCARPAEGQVQKVTQGKKPVVKTPAAEAKKPAKLLDGLLIKRYSWVGGDVEVAVTPEFLRYIQPDSAQVCLSARLLSRTVVAEDSSGRGHFTKLSLRRLEVSWCSAF